MAGRAGVEYGPAELGRARVWQNFREFTGALGFRTPLSWAVPREPGEPRRPRLRHR